MQSIPQALGKKKFVGMLFQKNLELWFYDPRHWRLNITDIKKNRIEFLNFTPPRYDFIIHVTLTDGQKLQFYQGVAATKSPRKTQSVYGKAKIGTSDFYFVDGYTSIDYVEGLLEAWTRKDTLGSLGFVGKLPGDRGDVTINLRSLKILSKPGQEPTTNYLYRIRGSAKITSKKQEFDIIAKRFLPRAPFNRGNNEYAILKALPRAIVPRTRGVLVNHRLPINGESQVLVLFSDFLEDAHEIGKLIWDLMETISRKKEIKKNAAPELRQLETAVQQAVEKVVFPFHKAGFETWHPNGSPIKAKAHFFSWYHLELEQDLKTLESTETMNANRVKMLSGLFRTAWPKILGRIPATEIHGDLMWRQILKVKNRLVILDLDEHVKGHAAKDVADLCAANRFIAEDLQSPHHDYMKNLGENLNALILKSYMKKAAQTNAPWASNLENALKIYLAFRHLHDAAYYAPVWHQAKTAEEKAKYKRYVGFSIDWFDKSVKTVETLLD